MIKTFTDGYAKKADEIKKDFENEDWNDYRIKVHALKSTARTLGADTLGELAFARTSVFLDACFSGVNRNNEGVTEGLREVEIEAEEASFSEGNVIVFSAAQGNETAQGYPEEGHGLFTYFLLKELKDTNGTISFGDLSDRLATNVSRQALQLKLQKKQTPAIRLSETMTENWRDLSF
jgi:hypothetical protein